MRSVFLFAGCLVFLAVASRAEAVDVYRCNGPHGVPIFQDQPCAGGQGQKIVRLPDPSPAASPPGPAPPDEDDNRARPSTPDAGPLPRAPPPSFFLCTRYDGSRYLSDDGRGGSNAVPLGMLGLPERSLADAYGGRNGIGVSAPGLRPIAQIPAAQAPLGGSYVWIADQCHRAAAAEACAYLRTQRDEVADKLRRAFSDEAPALRTKAQDLRERMRGC